MHQFNRDHGPNPVEPPSINQVKAQGEVDTPHLVAQDTTMEWMSCSCDIPTSYRRMGGGAVLGFIAAMSPYWFIIRFFPKTSLVGLHPHYTGLLGA